MPGRSVAEVQADPEFQALPPGDQQEILRRVMAAGVASYKGAPDQPLETPLLDPVDFAPTGMGAKAGATAGRKLAEGPLRGLFRWRMGSNPAAGFENVATAIQHTAPAAVRPTEATAEGLSQVMRSGSGQKALSASRQTGMNTLDAELRAAEKAAPT